MMIVPASLVALAVQTSGYRCSPATLRQWVHRGHIHRHPGGYDLREILCYLDGRADLPRDHEPVTV